MRRQRSFSLEFKRQVVEEVVSGQSRPAQVCRRYEISSSLLYHWKRQYARGNFNNEPTDEAALRDRVEKLERLVGKLTLENEFLKRGLQNSLAQAGRNGRSSHAGDGSWTASEGGAG
jgi:transposase-like protein